MSEKCLFCYEELADIDKDFHKKCSRKFFGTDIPPVLELSLSDLEKYAINMLQNRVSVTGVQPKLSVDIEKSKNAPSRLTIVGLWGQYILKPPYSNYPEMPELEDLTMRLAESTGITTAEHSLIRMQSGELAYLSKRFDRTPSGKLHVEDFAQLLEVMTERKYSGSVEKIGKAIKQYSSFPGNDVINLFELVLFCYITGNTDMHLKNFSLLRDEQDDIKLSPAYDLLSTKLLLPEDTEEFAVTVNGKKSKLTRKDFDMLASNLGLTEKASSSIYNKFSKSYNDWISLINKSFISEATKEKYAVLILDKMKQIGLAE